MKCSVFGRAVLIALILGALAAHPVAAQITTGTVAGSVKDEQGLPIPGATVTLTTTRLGGGGQNNIMMDGVSTMDTGNNGQLLQMNPEAIAEVKVLTAGYQAEYGRSSGLQITAVTKSGTNRFRGSVYDVMRNSDWNSNSWVNKINGTPKAVDKQSDWGYTFGGPIGKPGANNKLFFFYSHEYRPRNAANTLRQFRVPTQAERNGDFSASLDNNGTPIPALRDPVNGGTFPGNRIPQDRLYQLGLNILNAYILPAGSCNLRVMEDVAPRSWPTAAPRWRRRSSGAAASARRLPILRIQHFSTRIRRRMCRSV